MARTAVDLGAHQTPLDLIVLPNCRDTLMYIPIRVDRARLRNQILRAPQISLKPSSGRSVVCCECKADFSQDLLTDYDTLSCTTDRSVRLVRVFSYRKVSTTNQSRCLLPHVNH